VEGLENWSNASVDHRDYTKKKNINRGYMKLFVLQKSIETLEKKRDDGSWIDHISGNLEEYNL